MRRAKLAIAAIISNNIKRNERGKLALNLWEIIYVSIRDTRFSISVNLRNDIETKIPV